MLRASFLALLLTIGCYGQKYYVYVGNLSTRSVLLAWGTTDGKNTIGRSSPSHGTATVKIAGQTLESRQNWMVIGDLKPDTEYSYEVSLNGTVIGTNKFRTWSEANKLAFMVIGDFGNGSKTQYAIAKAMLDEFTKRSGSTNPIRFVLTTGDNVYGDINNIILGAKNTGADDKDWERKFFEPYQGLLAHVPFYPTLGNHDGNETESHRDLPAYLDNFFFPDDKPARYYSFTYGDNFAQFFGLDSTLNTESGPARAQYLENGPQWKWMQEEFSRSKAAWKIPYYHHPVFNAGPRHVASYRELQHWIQFFSRSGVKVVFNGHEHNFQASEVNAASGNIRFVTSGAGGELRGGSVVGRMRQNNIAAWTAQNHFLVVEMEGRTMTITPISWEPVVVVDPDGKPFPMPLEVKQ